MDKETRTLRRVLLAREALRAKLAASDRELPLVLRTWSDSRPHAPRGGIATEAGATFLLRQMGMLPDG